jgi:hypothetical protein
VLKYPLSFITASIKYSWLTLLEFISDLTAYGYEVMVKFEKYNLIAAPKSAPATTLLQTNYDNAVSNLASDIRGLVRDI